MAEREGDLKIGDNEPVKVKIIDNGENFNREKGSIPNHDKIEIVYIQKDNSNIG